MEFSTLLNSLQSIPLDKIVVSIISIVLLLMVRHGIIRAIRHGSEFLSEEQRTWISRTKNLSVLLIFLLLFMIWRSELHAFALSIAAVAVAFVLASKEMILCLSGAVMRTASGAFSVGDWIEVGELRGEVLEMNMLSTTIQELDTANKNYDYTGKTITLPNSQFLSQPVKNMNFMKRYVFHRFSIVVEPGADLFRCRQQIMGHIEKLSEEFTEVAHRYNAIIEKRAGIDIPSADPRIRISTNEQAKTLFTVTIFCPVKLAIELEQQITEAFMAEYYSNLAQTPLAV